MQAVLADSSEAGLWFKTQTKHVFDAVGHRKTICPWRGGRGIMGWGGDASCLALALAENDLHLPLRLRPLYLCDTYPYLS